MSMPEPASPPDRVAVDVWTWTAPFDLSGVERVLDSVERSRRSAYRRQIDADRFAAGAILLRNAVASRFGDPAAVVVDRTCETCGAPHGRPRLPELHLQVSVAHGGDVVTVAVADGAAVGIDVEPIRPVETDVIRTACAPEEWPLITGATAFARVWTRKEAVLKALGTGLSIEPATLVVSPPDQPARVVSLAGRPPPVCAVVDLSWPNRHLGALAILGSGRPLVIRRSASDVVQS